METFLHHTLVSGSIFINLVAFGDPFCCEAQQTGETAKAATGYQNLKCVLDVNAYLSYNLS